ncbi:hypothetical protein C5167_006648 [Papaver somniferum]|uniref:Uncharacterized protein n=1 Tax=Papaver somniferum TaxID=3469 RepID=A0A4Y7JH08_PAPSO|nr:hypothetical protein C5167_006648 [Papaver somniferum]
MSMEGMEEERDGGSYVGQVASGVAQLTANQEGFEFEVVDMNASGK